MTDAENTPQDDVKPPSTAKMVRDIFLTVGGIGAVVAGGTGLMSMLPVDPPSAPDMGNPQDCITDFTIPFTSVVKGPGARQTANAIQNNDRLIPECPTGFDTMKTGKYSSESFFDADIPQPAPTQYYKIGEKGEGEGGWITAEQAQQQGLELSYEIAPLPPQSAQTDPANIPSSLGEKDSSISAALKQVDAQVQRSGSVRLTQDSYSQAKQQPPSTPKVQQQSQSAGASRG